MGLKYRTPTPGEILRPLRRIDSFSPHTWPTSVNSTVCNWFPGWLNDVNGAGADNPAGYGPMLVFFAVLALGAFVFSVALWRRETGPHNHGLELPGGLR